MKIGIYITNITHSAGTERVVAGLANNLIKKDIEVDILSFCTKSGSPFYHIDKKIFIKHIGGNDYENKILLKKIILFLYTFIKFLFTKKNYDLIISTSLNTNLCALITKKSYQRIIICEHFPYNKPMPIIYKKIRNSIYRKTDTLVVLTERDKIQYQKVGINTICIPNFSPFLPHLDLKNKQKIALAIGRHTKQKSFDKLINIWSEGEFYKKGWTLYIVGDGELYNTNIQLAKNLSVNKSILFKKTTKQIDSIYKKSSIYLMTSLFEAFPMVLLESKSFGLPIISFDCETGPKEIIKNGVDGFLINKDNHSEFIKKLNQIINDPIYLRKMSENAYKDSFNYSKDIIMNKWYQLLNI